MGVDFSNRGAFVKLTGGPSADENTVVGMLPTSRMAPGGFLGMPSDCVKIGDSVEVRILSCSFQGSSVNVSLKMSLTMLKENESELADVSGFNEVSEKQWLNATD